MEPSSKDIKKGSFKSKMHKSSMESIQNTTRIDEVKGAVHAY